MPGSARRDDLFRKRLDVFTRMLPGVAQGDVRSVHRARVASRRLRELVPVLNLEADAAAKLTRRLRKATARLGRVRELDVMLQLVDELDHAPDVERQALDSVRSAIVQERADARSRFAGDGRSITELRRLAAKLRSALEDVGADRGGNGSRATAAHRHDWQWALGARVVRRIERLRRAIDDAGTVYAPERLHDVRIALKKARYAMELAADARRQKTTADLRALARAQDVLGRLHDLQMLIARARHAGDDVAMPALAQLIDTLETDCRHLHARYLRQRAEITAIGDRAAGGATRRSARQPAAVRRSA